MTFSIVHCAGTEKLSPHHKAWYCAAGDGIRGVSAQGCVEALEVSWERSLQGLVDILVRTERVGSEWFRLRKEAPCAVSPLAISIQE